MTPVPTTPADVVGAPPSQVSFGTATLAKVINWPENLKPTTSEILSLSDHHEIAVPKAVPRFSPWLGPPPGDTFGGKTLLDFKGRPAFAELIILWSFIETGWEGVWVDSFQKRYLRGFWPAPLSETLPRERDDLRLCRGEETRT